MKTKLPFLLFVLYMLVPSICSATNYHKILVSGKMYTLPNPLVYIFSKDNYRFKYILDIDKKEGSYWYSYGKKWNKMSSFTILRIVDERERFQGELVFNVYFAPQSPLNKLQISRNWDKLAGSNNKWFHIETQ